MQAKSGQRFNCAQLKNCEPQEAPLEAANTDIFISHLSGARCHRRRRRRFVLIIIIFRHIRSLGACVRLRGLVSCSCGGQKPTSSQQ